MTEIVQPRVDVNKVNNNSNQVVIGVRNINFYKKN
jgi:hypothetical protein